MDHERKTKALPFRGCHACHGNEVIARENKNVRKADRDGYIAEHT